MQFLHSLIWITIIPLILILLYLSAYTTRIINMNKSLPTQYQMPESYLLACNTYNEIDCDDAETYCSGIMIYLPHFSSLVSSG